jgi:hypothetical protein
MLLSKVVEWENVAMREDTDSGSLALKTAHEWFIATIKDLDGHASPYASIIAKIDFRHAATGYAASQLVTPQLRAFYPLHRSSLLQFHSTTRRGRHALWLW